jgi:universal stress protein E
MSPFSSILVVLDPTASEQPALGKALQLAMLRRANVELLLCDMRAGYEKRLSQSAPSALDAINLDLRRWVESLATPLRDAGIDVTVAIIRGDSLHTTILKWLKNSPADLVVKDTHHHSLIRRTLLSNTDWHLIRECPQPLLLTKATRWRQPLCIGAAIDPTHPQDSSASLDRAVMAATTNLALTVESRIQVFSAYYPAMLAAAVAGATVPMPVTNEAMEAERGLHLNAVAALLQGFDVPEECRHVSLGVPGEFLPRMAEQLQVDIMVMGALSRSRLKQRVIGSTAERLLQHLPCDILTVKPLDWSSSLPF